MPLPRNVGINEIPSLVASKIQKYNNSPKGAVYNNDYAIYISLREKGIKEIGSLSGWASSGKAIKPIQDLLIAYGMNARESQIVSPLVFQSALSDIGNTSLDWVSNFELPLTKSPALLINPVSGLSLSEELTEIYNMLSTPNVVTVSGGFVASSKTMHCLFPNLSPMIDGTHSGISYYNISRFTYKPPSICKDWEEWIGHSISHVLNPSPRGAGRNSWRADQFLASIGVNQHIYELWQTYNGELGFTAFLALDQNRGTTGIPRIIDKVLW